MSFLETMRREAAEIHSFGKIYRYPCGIVDYIACSSPVFKTGGWELAGREAGKYRPERGDTEAEALGIAQGEAPDPDPESMKRAVRRARAKVRRLALSNDFRWFVTLTLNKEKVDRYDPAAVVRKLNQWCSNQVKRKGLKYVLVPERHEDGALHFHGFFSDSLIMIPSGHYDGAGHEIFNIPGWALGFTAAIQLYGNYPAAVAYVCKYIGKQGDKPAGRWYYSGGELCEPAVEYADFSAEELREMFGEQVFEFEAGGRGFAVVNGVKPER
jgi:hypothetical protein